MIRFIGKRILSSFKNLLYPPLCLHCNRSIQGEHAHLCAGCSAQLELIEPTERCPLCFSGDFCPVRLNCSQCRFESPVLDKVAAAFDHTGPAATLVKKFKYSNQPYLAKGLAAYMAMQFVHLNWPLPDLIVPVPLSFTHWLSRGYNQTELLACSLSSILECPVGNLIKRRSGDYSQAGLKKKERLKLDSENFQLRKGANVADQTILLLDDVITTGRTLRCCAEVLLEGCPTAIYGLTVCRAVDL